MSGRNAFRILGEALKNGEKFDLFTGESLKILPETDDTGSIQIGDGSTDMDFTIFLGSTSNYVKLDVGASTITLVGVTLSGNLTTDSDITLGDNNNLYFGDSDDIRMRWNGSTFFITPGVHDTGNISIGTGGKFIDVYVWTDAAKYVQFDVGTDTTRFVDVALTTNSTITTTGDGMVVEKTISEGDATVTVTDTELGGTMILSRAGVTAVTLPTPAAGNAGKWIEIVSTTTNQHTITAGANLIVAVGDAAATTLTASAVIGNAIKLISDGSLWYEIGIVGTWTPT